ncbi:Hsp20/alpha crystallin family protein [Megamonas hypermegale]|uniref:Hsp20/alpha crystallin family protein n=1 Tax=Megamonas hypermegale TaxID=158847 RepID=UPI0025A3E722|nr:Hsp20/alpha crystallin family protein [Megamonas hypermegale]MDM8142500.1 Hsp20/alpha crystallin family protein [Megamonas hypermegale]
MFGLVPFAKNISNKDDDFNSLFDVFNEPFFHNALSPFSTAKSFKVDVKDLGSAYELTAELPGIKKENISLSYENSYLTIKVANKEEKTVDDKEKQSEKYLRRERYYGEMQRSFYIDDIDEANVKAAYKDGILTVTLPKAVKKETATAINID